MRIRQALMVIITILAAGDHFAYGQGYNATSRANITAYGGKADNGVTDNGLALNSAIAALPSTGGTVYIPASGNGDAYVIATSVNPAKPVVLACDSPSTTTLLMAPSSPAGFFMLAPSSDFTITSCTIDGNQANQPDKAVYSQATVKWTGTGYFGATENIFQNGGEANLLLGDVSSQICPKEIQVDHNKFLNDIGHGGSSGQNSGGVLIVCDSAQTGISSSIEIHFNKFLQSTPALNGTFPILVGGNPPVSPPSIINLSASITDNEFNGCGNNNKDNPGGCITLYFNAGRTEIANNRFFNFVYAPIAVADSPMVDIHDNVIDGPAMSLISGNGYMAGAGATYVGCILFYNFTRPPFFNIGSPAYGATIHDNIIGNKYSLGCPGAGIDIEGESTSWVADRNFAVGQMVRPDAAAPVPQQPYMFQVTAATGGSCPDDPHSICGDSGSNRPTWPTNTAIPTYTSGGLNNGLNDATFEGLQTAVAVHTYTVIIDGTPSGADTFKWNVDSGPFTTGMSITAGVELRLANGIRVTFRNQIGHTLGAQWVITTPVIVNDNQLTWENVGPISAFPSRVSVSHNIIENSCMGLYVHGVGSISLDSNQINGSLCTTPSNFSSVIFSDVYGDIDFYHNKIRNGQGYGVLADNIQNGDSQLARFYLKDNEFEGNGIAIPGLFNDVRLSGTIAGPQLAYLQANTFLGPYIYQSILVNDATTTNLINNTIPNRNTVLIGGAAGTTRTDSGNSFDGGPASGMVSVNDSTSGFTNFAKPYANAPNCTLTPISDPTTVGSFWATSTTQAVTAHVHDTGTIVFIYHCDGF
jgi:hypothetical protein